MPFDLQSSLGTLSNYVFGSELLNSVLGSNILLALIITIMMILFIAILYPAKQDTSIRVLGNIGLYSFLATVILLFMHDSVLQKSYEEDKKVDDAAQFMRDTSNSRGPVYGNGHVVIQPNTSQFPTQYLGAAQQSQPQQSNDQPDEELQLIPMKPLDTQTKDEYSGSIINGGSVEALNAIQAPPPPGNPFNK